MTKTSEIPSHDGQSPETVQALMQRDISEIKVLVTDIQKTLKEEYVTKEQFNPVKEKINGMQGFFYTVGTSAVLLIVAGVLKMLLRV